MSEVEKAEAELAEIRQDQRAGGLSLLFEMHPVGLAALLAAPIPFFFIVLPLTYDAHGIRLRASVGFVLWWVFYIPLAIALVRHSTSSKVDRRRKLSRDLQQRAAKLRHRISTLEAEAVAREVSVELERAASARAGSNLEAEHGLSLDDPESEPGQLSMAQHKGKMSMTGKDESR